MIESELIKGRFLDMHLTKLLSNQREKFFKKIENELQRHIYKESKKSSDTTLFKIANDYHSKKNLSSSIRLAILQEKGFLQSFVTKYEIENNNSRNFITKDLDLEIFGSISKVQTEILNSFFGYLTASFAAFFAFLRILS